MGRAIEVLCGQVTDPDTTFTAWTMNTGNSLTIRNTRPESKIHLMTAWALNQIDGELRIISPRLHDNVNNLRFAIEASGGWGLLIDPMFGERLYPQDTLVVAQTGSSTAADIELGALLLYYEDLQGVDARLATPAFVKSKMRFLKTVPVIINTGTAGDYSGEQTLVADFSELKANTDYALLGYTLLATAPLNTIRIRGNDTGNLGIGMPALQRKSDFTSRFFIWLSERTGLPCVPIFNSANGSNILVDCHANEVDANPTISLIFAELMP